MKLVVGSKNLEIKPHLIARCGTTENITFGLYEDNVVIKQFEDAVDMGTWFANIVILETWEEKPVE